MTTKTPPKAIVGRCPKCSIRTARAELDDGSLIEAEVGNLTPTAELRAHLAGHATYRAIWKNTVLLKARTARDIKLNPAGYDGGRIWKEHRCA